jgi:hypothetical protein
MDSLRRSARLMVTGIGQFLHLGRIHPHLAGTRVGSPGDQPFERTQKCGVAPMLSLCRIEAWHPTTAVSR